MQAACCDFAERFLVVFAPLVAAVAADALLSALLGPEAGVLAGVLAMLTVDTALVVVMVLAV